MTTTQRLMQAVAPIWDAYNTHPFVLGIQNGTLPQEKFRFYILQDYLYLQDYSKAFAIGVAKAKSLETARLFAQYIPVMDGELDIHSGYLAKLNVTQQELDQTPRALDNLSYTSYMLRIAYEEGEAEALTAILACACSYQQIAQRMVAARPESVQDPFYGEWVQGYLSEGYAASNQVLLDTLDRLTAHYTEPQLAHLTDIFTACSRYELTFWEMSWQQKL